MKNKQEVIAALPMRQGAKLRALKAASKAAKRHEKKGEYSDAWAQDQIVKSLVASFWRENTDVFPYEVGIDELYNSPLGHEYRIAFAMLNGINI